MIKKRCKKCGKLKFLEDNFHKNLRAKDGHFNHCKVCRSESAKLYNIKNRNLKREYYIKNFEKIQKKRKEWYYNNHEEIKERNNKASRKSSLKLKIDVIINLGGKCVCCGETNVEFLTIDHISGGGTLHRKLLGSKGIYRDVKKQGYPKNKYRVLCFNCNCAIGAWGYCPHKKLKGEFSRRRKMLNMVFLERGVLIKQLNRERRLKQ